MPTNGSLYDISFNKYYVDEIYDVVIGPALYRTVPIFRQIVDPWVIDGAVNGLAANGRRIRPVWREVCRPATCSTTLAMFLGRRPGAARLLPRTTVMISAQSRFGDLEFATRHPGVGAAVLSVVCRGASRPGCSPSHCFASAVAFLWSLKILNRFDGTNGEMQLVERVAWMPAFTASNISSVSTASAFFWFCSRPFSCRWRCWLPGRCATRSKSI